MATDFPTMILLRLLYGMGAGLDDDCFAPRSSCSGLDLRNEVPIINTLLLVVVSDSAPQYQLRSLFQCPKLHELGSGSGRIRRP